MERRCDFTDLVADWCAHCLGHVGEWEKGPDRAADGL